MILPEKFTNTLLAVAVAFVCWFFLVVTEANAQVSRESSESVKNFTGESIFPLLDQHESKAKETTDKYSKSPSVVDPRLRDNARFHLHDKSNVASDGKSTLSFNIFLFVLDRFKEDQEGIGEKGD
jgi:hypothetical protein